MKASIVKCRSCGAKMIWMRTKAGNSMPVDWDVKFIDDTEYSKPAGHISHFSSCPHADRFRRKKK